MPREYQSILPVESTLQYQDTFLSKASIESLSQNFSPEENIAHAKNLVATGRQYWKTRGSQGEAIWPPHVEIALLEGLKRYQKSDRWKPIRDHRCPMRNKFISEHIQKTTGVSRTPRQISSRIQHLRDTCQAQSIVDLIAPFKPEATPTSSSKPLSCTPPGQSGNPYPKSRASSHVPNQVHNSLSENKEGPPLGVDKQIAEPVPLRPLVSPLILTMPLSYLLPESNSSQFNGSDSTMTPQNPMPDCDFTLLQDASKECSTIQLQNSSPISCSLAPVYIVDVFLDNTTSSVPLVPLAAMNDTEPLEISLAFQEISLSDGSLSLDTVVQLVSPCPLLSQTVLSVFITGCQTSIYTEATTLLCNSVPICGTDWFYMVTLLPNFWNTLSYVAADPRDYVIEQTIVPLRPESLPNELDHDARGTHDKPSTICYRFCSIGSSSLHLCVQSHPPHNSWDRT